METTRIANGSQFWYKNNKRHQDCGLPAIEHNDGDKSWWVNGKLHRDFDLPAIEKVNYTGLSSHPDHVIAQKQMKKHAPLISFELKGGLEAGKIFIDALEVCTRAVSLGTVDTLVSHPATMTHYGIPREERIKYGITDGLIRMSVGIENYEDLEADLAQALAKI